MLAGDGIAFNQDMATKFTREAEEPIKEIVTLLKGYAKQMLGVAIEDINDATIAAMTPEQYDAMPGIVDKIKTEVAEYETDVRKQTVRTRGGYEDELSSLTAITATCQNTIRKSR